MYTSWFDIPQGDGRPLYTWDDIDLMDAFALQDTKQDWEPNPQREHQYNNCFQPFYTENRGPALREDPGFASIVLAEARRQYLSTPDNDWCRSQRDYERVVSYLKKWNPRLFETLKRDRNLYEREYNIESLTREHWEAMDPGALRVYSQP